jgi:site-specific recombinase XerD
MLRPGPSPRCFVLVSTPHEDARGVLRGPGALDRVLLNPATGKPLTRQRLYERTLKMGRRAGVLGVHPHRFRDTFAVDLLARGASPYDVAKLLGDTVETVERHYAPFVRELRERARGGSWKKGRP